MEEALRFVDENGVAALSMRKLGNRLGVEAMSLYEYVASKNDLLDAIADRVASELSLVSAPNQDWQARIRNAVAAWVRIEEAHPGGFPLLYRNREGTDKERAVTEELMGALTDAGFSATDVALLYQTLICFLDAALLHWPRSIWNVRDPWEYAAREIDPARFPRLAATAPHAAELDWDQVFSTGLELFLLGLQDQLTAHRATTSPSD